jgi:diguanylate cyclase (GGDEF)-like protein
LREAQKIHDAPQLDAIGIIILSSDDIAIEQNQANQYGISFFINKPVSQKKLLNCLLDSLGGHKRHRPDKLEQAAAKLKGHILLAEDNKINQEVGIALLRMLGCTADLANNGVEAIKKTASNKYDAVLMDCHMPEMDGFEATQKIRQYEKEHNKPHTPIIALTADVQKGIIEKCLDIGMDDYLSKPFTAQQLSTLLGKWLKNQQKGIADSLLNEEKVNHSILDSTALETLRSLTTESGESVLNKTIHLFLDSAEQEVRHLEGACERGDFETLGKNAHGFKSACANLGAQQMSKLAAGVEAAAIKQEQQDCYKSIEKIRALLPGTLSALAAQLNEDMYFNSISAVETEKESPGAKQFRVLLVDDDPSFCLITRAALTASSFIVDQAENGQQALEMAARHQPDIIMLDAVMEGMDGFETCLKIRENPVLADTPVIMSTGLGDVESIQRAFDVGANDFIVKPINYPILLHRLWFILRASQNSAALKESQMQLTAAQRIARLGYWIWDVTNNTFEISEHLAELCQLDLEAFDASLDSFLQLVAEEDREMVRNMIMEAPYSKTIQHIEYRLQLDDGDILHVHQEMVKTCKSGKALITGTVQDISQRVRNEERIHQLAYFDHLTGIASRFYFQERIQNFIEDARRRHERFAFLFLDLDGFKDINDSMGHVAGDELLKEVALRIQQQIRSIDFTARLGGDEFCILLNNISSDDFVVNVAERCLKNINMPVLLANQQVKPRVSIGIAIYPRDGHDAVSLMKAADTAMYAAKKAGKQCFSFYSEDMAMEAVSRLEKENMLREAFEQDQFILHYQPQISMETGKMVGMEALVRWQHPEQGVISPGAFIQDLEEMGLIVELGNRVLNTACEQLSQWHQMGMPMMPISVNISALHFQDSNLLDTIQVVLKKFDIPSHFLELEVTESTIQSEECLKTIVELRDLGVKIAIDDFGTGYSCLASLKDMALDCIKIDKVFVDDVLTNSNTSLLIGTIIGLANALGYVLVAEGVESKEQMLVMHGLGCQVIQGYYFSKPVNADQIPQLQERQFLAGIH